MFEMAYNSFNDYVDSEISHELNQCQINHNAIYNVIDVSTEYLKKEFDNLKYIPCPICNNDTFGFDEISCPKCGGDFLSVMLLMD